VNLPHRLFSFHFFSHPSPFSVPFFPLPSPSLLFPSTGVLPINPVREREHCELPSGSGCRLPDKIVSCDCCVEKVVREKQSMGCRLYGFLTVGAIALVAPRMESVPIDGLDARTPIN